MCSEKHHWSFYALCIMPYHLQYLTLQSCFQNHTKNIIMRILTFVKASFLVFCAVFFFSKSALHAI